MRQVKQALKTLWTLLKNPWGTGSPIPLRENKPKQLRFDEHTYATTGDDEVAA